MNHWGQVLLFALFVLAMSLGTLRLLLKSLGTRINGYFLKKGKKQDLTPLIE